MTSIIGLPTQGSEVKILITKVHLHPLCALVEFWGKFSQERTADYESLAKDIQSPGNLFQAFEGNAGDQCLVQIDGTWYRSRIVSRNGSQYSVFLIDRGMTFKTSCSNLAWGKKKHFVLPPEVEFCVLANVLPLSPENRWSPVGVEFLKSLSGMSVNAYVQDLLLAHRTFLLDIPCISKHMYEMGIAKKLAPDMFQDFVLKSLQSQSGAKVIPRTGVTPKGEEERLHKQDLFLYPELQAGTVETVIVTDVTNPLRLFCQLKVFSQELRKLSEQITQCCEGRIANCLVGAEMVGFPCAARGSDNKWYRSVLQQVFPNNQVVEVLNVDYGTKQIVQVENVRPLATEFFRMPVVTYICSLHGIIDKGVGWTTSQIDYLRSLLLHKTVIAKFEYQSVSEGVHYVTLYGDENINLNNLFASQVSSSLESEKTFGDYALNSAAYRCGLSVQQGHQRKKLEEDKDKAVVQILPAENLSLNSTHVAVVHEVHDPSKFWIQTQNHSHEFDKMMDRINHLYKDPVNKDGVRNPSVGLYCASKAEDGDFYRATVAEVGETKIKVFFVDYGNTEVVDRSNIRTLPDEFRKLPCLALKCTLAGIKPKGEKWSQSACEFFIKSIKDKELKVHVTAKHDEGYVVKLAYPEAQGEKDLAVVMCSSGFAEKADAEKETHARMTMGTGALSAAQDKDKRLSGMPLETVKTMCLVGNQRTPTFKEYMFPTGSVLDVSVSYMESPNDFWCQLVQNAGALKLLMHDMQAYYAGSEFQPPAETACVARHPENKMWYRALIIHKHETPHFDVLFVDYGQTETVSLYDLRKICPRFLSLQGQAFRCSLLNPVDPTSATNEWNEEATAHFHNFVETAGSSFLILKCTIYAVMYSELKVVFNIVDLETPFESVLTSMVNLLKSAPPKKAAGASFRLDTYYYSTHNVKTGTEEEVTVTCVKNVGQFYCQLERNADVIKDLQVKVNSLCHQLQNVKFPTVFGTLCFAKYTDGLWYRGQIKATKPSICVHFVDYGDTIEVEKSDLLPVPREATDIMSVPVQALVCSLSDVPSEIPDEMNTWFEKNVTECIFRALVVAREPDGKLLVELYDGNIQINSKIKKKFQIEMHAEDIAVHQVWRAPDRLSNQQQKSLKTVEKQVGETDTLTTRNSLSASKPTRKLRDDEKNSHSESKLRRNLDSGQRVKAAPLKLYQHPHQRKACGMTEGSTGNGTEPSCAYKTQAKPRKANLPAETEQLGMPKSPATDSQKEHNVEKLPKLEDLPSKPITSGMAEDVYVSHCNSPLSFYVQLLREEDAIFSLVEKLNDSHSISETNDKVDLHPGDLVQAEFAEDSSWYRAVVKEIHSNEMALVEFVDYGNTVLVPVSKIGRIHKSFLQLPLYSTKCMLGSAATLEKEKVLDPEVVSAFKEDIGAIGEKVLKCTFIRHSGSVWEVTLESSGVNLVCNIPTLCVTDGSEISSDKLQVKEKPSQQPEKSQVSGNSQLKPLPLCYPQQDFSEGQKLDVYITTTNDAQTFWCQSADSEELDKITSGVAEVGNSADHKHESGSLSPGSPCIALFSDDTLWYRAEVINNKGDELFVFFVDYGNCAQVRVADVRKIPRNLIEIPPQAFLCALEGFDTSNRSLESGAIDELSALTADKCLQLTITRVTREEGKLKCLVHLGCEDLVINEALKPWWRSSVAVIKPNGIEPTTFHKTTLQHNQSPEEIAPPEDLLKNQNQYLDVAIVTDLPQDHIDQENVDEPVDSHTTEGVQHLERSLRENERSEASWHPEYILQSPGGEKEQILSEGNLTTESLSLKTVEILREPISIDTINVVPATVILPHDGASDTTMLPTQCNTSTEEEFASVIDTNVPDDFNSLLDENSNEAIDLMITTTLEFLPGEMYAFCSESSLSETILPCKTERDLEEKESTTMASIGPDDSNSDLDENPKEATDGSGIKTPEKVYDCSEEMSVNIMISDPTEGNQDEEVSITRDDSTTSTTTVKMVPREAMWPTENTDLFGIINNAFEDLKQNDLVAEVETLAQNKDAHFDVQPDDENEDGAGHACLASCQASDVGADYETSSVKETFLMEFCTDPNQPSDEEVISTRDNALSCMTVEDMVKPESPRPCGELHDNPLTEAPSKHDVQVGDFSLQEESVYDENTWMTEEETITPSENAVSALQPDSQAQACTFPCQDVSHLVEEVACLIGKICLTDVCRDTNQELETDDAEQLMDSPSEHKEDFNDGVLEEELSFSDESFEDQLSKIIHLSLKINDGSADILPIQQQSEE